MCEHPRTRRSSMLPNKYLPKTAEMNLWIEIEEEEEEYI